MRAASLLATSILLISAVALAGSPKQVYKKSSPAVVLILGSDDGKAGAGGTGSIITSEGKVITNAHVVINEASGSPYRIIYVFLKPPKITGDNGRDLANRYKARVLSFSPADELDLAVLQIESPPPNLPTIAFANPDEVEVGDEVVAIGHPEMGGLWTLTTGTISTVIANFSRVKGKDVFQTEASVNRGNSGGPLLDSDGNMVGINTMIARQGAGGVTITDVNFSLKSSVAVKWLAGAAGLGLAYAPTNDEVVVAMAPQAPRKAETPPAAAVSPTVTTPPATAVTAQVEPKPAEPQIAPQPVREPPPATIVVAEKPPKKAEVNRDEDVQIGKDKGAEKVVAGKPLDPKKQPKIIGKKRPYSLDELRRQQMKELEDIMEDARGKINKKKSGNGMGLW